MAAEATLWAKKDCRHAFKSGLLNKQFKSSGLEFELPKEAFVSQKVTFSFNPATLAVKPRAGDGGVA